MLVRKSNVPTNFVLPVILNGSYELYWYYESEKMLFKAYNQLKKINGNYKPKYPIILDEVIEL